MNLCSQKNLSTLLGRSKARQKENLNHSLLYGTSIILSSGLPILAGAITGLVKIFIRIEEETDWGNIKRNEHIALLVVYGGIALCLPTILLVIPTVITSMIFTTIHNCYHHRIPNIIAHSFFRFSQHENNSDDDNAILYKSINCLDQSSDEEEQEENSALTKAINKSINCLDQSSDGEEQEENSAFTKAINKCAEKTAGVLKILTLSAGGAFLHLCLTAICATAGWLAFKGLEGDYAGKQMGLNISIIGGSAGILIIAIIALIATPITVIRDCCCNKKRSPQEDEDQELLQQNRTNHPYQMFPNVRDIYDNDDNVYIENREKRTESNSSSAESDAYTYL